jgi:hypothetical protein
MFRNADFKTSSDKPDQQTTALLHNNLFRFVLYGSVASVIKTTVRNGVVTKPKHVPLSPFLLCRCGFLAKEIDHDICFSLVQARIFRNLNNNKK